MKKVLILGGGFAGVEAAIYLKKNSDINVTLVSERDYFYIYPTSIWIPTGQTTPQKVSIPLIDLASRHNFELIVDKVTKIEAKTKTVTFKNGEILDGYDYLILAMGQDKIKLQGTKEHTLSICGDPKEAIELKKRLDILLERGYGKIAVGFGGNAKDSSAVRGGPAFEVLFNFHNTLKKRGLRDKFDLIFFAPMDKPGQKMGEKVLSMMDKMFKMTNIKRQTGVKISSFDEKGINFADSSKIEADLVMYIPAGRGHSVLENSDLECSDAGFVITNEYNEVNEYDGVYAIGDSASLMGSAWRAKQGHVAEVMARNTAHNIMEHINHTNNKKSYMGHLSILCVMDSGNGAVFVHRNDKGSKVIPLPFVGHWLKRGWGWYCRNSKLGKIPRIPGM